MDNNRGGIKFYFKNALTNMRGIKKALLIISTTTVISLVWGLCFMAFMLTSALVKEANHNYSEAAKQTIKLNLEKDVHNIISVAEENALLIDIDKSNLERAQQAVVNYIDAHYSTNLDTTYVIEDLDGNIIFDSSSSAARGTNKKDLADANGVNILNQLKSVTYPDTLEKKEPYGFSEFKMSTQDNKKTYDQLTFSHAFAEWNWIVSASYDITEVNEDIVLKTTELKALGNKRVIIMFVISSILGVSLLILSSVIGINLTYGVGLLVNSTQTMAKGDLTHRIVLPVNNELGDLNKAINIAQDQITNLIREINQIANNLNTTVSNFLETHSKMNSSIQNVSTSIADITENINKQAISTSQVSANIDDISSSIKETSNEVNVLEDNSQTIQDYSKKSLESLKELLSLNARTQNDIDEMHIHTEHTNDSIIKISKAAELINQIATQTNLLSLNASIEAARAGEHGKGFSVVASEIGALAAQSSTTVKEINSILDELNANSLKSMTIMNEMNKDSKLQNKTLHATSEIFENLVNSLTLSITSIENIANKIQIVNDKRDSIIHNIEQLNSFASNNAAYTEETSAITEELTDMVYTTSKEMEALSNDFEILNNNINNFKI